MTGRGVYSVFWGISLAAAKYGSDGPNRRDIGLCPPLHSLSLFATASQCCSEKHWQEPLSLCGRHLPSVLKSFPFLGALECKACVRALLWPQQCTWKPFSHYCFRHYFYTFNFSAYMTNPKKLIVSHFPMLACIYVLLVNVYKRFGFSISLSIEMTQTHLPHLCRLCLAHCKFLECLHEGRHSLFVKVFGSLDFLAHPFEWALRTLGPMYGLHQGLHRPWRLSA